jgi:hypothetical protein
LILRNKMHELLVDLTGGDFIQIAGKIMMLEDSVIEELLNEIQGVRFTKEICQAIDYISEMKENNTWEENIAIRKISGALMTIPHEVLASVLLRDEKFNQALYHLTNINKTSNEQLKSPSY